MKRKPIYLDYAATTPVHPEVASLMAACLTEEGNFGNPASRSHILGWQAEEAVENARSSIAKLLNADNREIIWTSGATESNNLALKGVVEARLSKQSFADLHIVTTSIEHKSVLDTAAYLEDKGVQVSYLKPNSLGRIDVDAVADVLQDNTVMVSVMHANNEMGVVNPVVEIAALCRTKGALFHTDAAQTAGKLAIDVKALDVDFISLSAHKMYGPKGIGALYVRRHPDVRLAAQIHGGGHERGMRSGTLPTHQIAGFGKAADIAQLDNDAEHTRELRDAFWNDVKEIPGVHLNGDLNNRLPGNLNIAFDDIDGETLLMSLQGLAISSGSACMSATIAPSYVLTEMGYSEERAQNSLRFSFGRFTSKDDIASATDQLKTALTHLSRATA